MSAVHPAPALRRHLLRPGEASLLFRTWAAGFAFFMLLG